MDELTPKQQLFVDEYLIDLDARKAALRAGYESCKNEGYYVYFLIDPNSGHIFYVGKGIGGRCYQHVKNVKKGIVDNVRKVKTISSILAVGNDVSYFVFQNNMQEQKAYGLENNIINKLYNHGITNVSHGRCDKLERYVFEVVSMLKRLKPFNIWMDGLTTNEIFIIDKVFGNPKAFHEKFKDNLERYLRELKTTDYGLSSEI